MPSADRTDQKEQGLRPIRVASPCFIHSVPLGNISTAPRPPKPDFFVIVDGQGRFERRGFTIKDTPFDVYVPLDSFDGFLTPFARDRSGGDWIGVGDPVLELRDR